MGYDIPADHHGPTPAAMDSAISRAMASTEVLPLTPAMRVTPLSIGTAMILRNDYGFDDLDFMALEVAAEVRRATRKHGPLNSPHEGWSVIYEELEELRDHVRADTGRSAEARDEAIQIAAMGLKYAENLCD